MPAASNEGISAALAMKSSPDFMPRTRHRRHRGYLASAPAVRACRCSTIARANARADGGIGEHRWCAEGLLAEREARGASARRGEGDRRFPDPELTHNQRKHKGK